MKHPHQSGNEPSNKGKRNLSATREDIDQKRRAAMRRIAQSFFGGAALGAIVSSCKNPLAPSDGGSTPGYSSYSSYHNYSSYSSYASYSSYSNYSNYYYAYSDYYSNYYSNYYIASW